MTRKNLTLITMMIAASLTFGCTAKSAPTVTAHEYQKAMETAQEPAAAPTPAPRVAQAQTAPSNPFYANPIEGMDPSQEPLTTESGSSAVALGGNVSDTSQVFDVKSLPDVIVVNTNTLEKRTDSAQPLMEHLKITGLRVAEDGKTVEFNVVNSFNRTNAKAIHTGGLMLSAQARYDYDNGAKLHNVVLLKEKRMVFQKGSNQFRTNPANYSHVTKLEKLQFFFIPTKSMQSPMSAGIANAVDTSEILSTDNLPKLVVVDPHTIEQHSKGKDPRLGFLKIKDLKMSNNTTFQFAIENTFDRQEAEPIHVGGIMVTGMARYAYDNGKDLHSCILFEEKHATLDQGLTSFTSNPELYPGVTKIESVQFFLTP